MKPLELPERINCGEDVTAVDGHVCRHYKVGGAWVDATQAVSQAREKRFTDAELSAEYWRANCNTRIRAYKRDEQGNIIDVPGVGWEYEHQVWRRFATLPSYDQESS